MVVVAQGVAQFAPDLALLIQASIGISGGLMGIVATFLASEVARRCRLCAQSSCVRPMLDSVDRPRRSARLRGIRSCLQRPAKK